nr:hypothetical protein CFP56_74903 [Quercus suber]
MVKTVEFVGGEPAAKDILIEVFAFEKGYINKEDDHHQVQDVLLQSNVHSSIFEVPDGDVHGSLIAGFPM